MNRFLSFGQKIGLGFAVVTAFALLIGGISIYALRSVVADKDRVIDVYDKNLIDAAKLHTESETRAGNVRGYAMTGDPRFLEELQSTRKEFKDLHVQLRKRTVSALEKQALEKIDQESAAWDVAADRLIEKRRADPTVTVVLKQFQEEVLPRYKELSKTIDAFVIEEERVSEEVKGQATEAASFATNLIVSAAGLGIVAALAIALFLSRVLSRQIGSAVQHIQSSSSELQSAANQQTTGSKEQVASMTEIATTIKELVVTARQIAESAQRVVRIAEETAQSARGGDLTVQKALEAVTNIKRQVDVIVTHMLDLGKKSQQIGGILEIINELAEQTNILAINATIEAAGAGEAGKRFAVVADEIRKLADRVGGSTKEIKTLIEEIRAAVHSTVMATESGSKAVDAGTRQFGEVSTAFQQIARLVETTTGAAREIELSTKQQTSAVEQVNIAIANVAQAAKETEASSTQTFQTVSELTALSRDLGRLIQPGAT